MSTERVIYTGYSGAQSNSVFFLAEYDLAEEFTAPTEFECKVKRDWITANSKYDFKVGETVKFYAGYKIFPSATSNVPSVSGVNQTIMNYTITEGATSLMAASAFMVASLLF